MQAEFVREAGGEVTFRKGGKLVTVPLDRLSDKDRKIVRDLAAGKAVPDEPAASSSSAAEDENPFKPVNPPTAEDENPFKSVDQSKADAENPFKPVDSKPADDNPFKPVTTAESAEESPFKSSAPAAADLNDPFRPVERKPEPEKPLKPTPAATGQAPKTETTQPAAETSRQERPKPAPSLTKKPVSPKPRGWAYRSGRTTTGKFVRIHNGNVVILRGTRTVTIPYSELSDADQAYVKDLLTSMGEEHLIPAPLPEGQAGGEQGLAANPIGGGQGVGGGAVGGGAAGGGPGSRNLAGTGYSGVGGQDIERSGAGPTSDRMRSSDFDRGASQREGMESSIDRMRERSDQLSDEHNQRRDELRERMEEQRNQFDAARDQIEAERERLRQEREQEREQARQNEFVAECLECKRKLTRAETEQASCPHCGVTWDYEIDQFGMRRSITAGPADSSGSNSSSSASSAASQMTPETQKMVASVVVIAVLAAIALAIVIGVIVIAVAIASASSTSKQRRYV